MDGEKLLTDTDESMKAVWLQKFLSQELNLLI